MKPVFQRICNQKNGDCLRAVICSMLEIPDDGIKNFVEYDNWIEELYRFVRGMGYDIYCYDEPLKCWDDYYLVNGQGPNGQHIVVYRNGKLAHDPTPGNEGVVPEEYWYLIPVTEHSELLAV